MQLDNFERIFVSSCVHSIRKFMFQLQNNALKKLMSRHTSIRPYGNHIAKELVNEPTNVKINKPYR